MDTLASASDELTRSEHLIDTYSPAGVARALANELRTAHALFFHLRNDRLALTTAHSVDTDDHGVPLVGPDDERAILGLLTGRLDEPSVEIQPASVLYRDSDALMWWLPPAVRSMHLRSHGEGMRPVLVRWPSLVMLVRDREVCLAAVQGEASPTGDSPLFHAPLGNVSADTTVCTGDARLPGGGAVRDMAAWESAILDTAFSHQNQEQTLKAVRKGRRGRAQEHADAEFWTARDGVTEPFSDERLSPLGVTLAGWLPRVRALPSGRRGEF